MIAAMMTITPTEVSIQAGRMSVTGLDVTRGSVQAVTEVSLTGTVTTANETDIQAGGSTVPLRKRGKYTGNFVRRPDGWQVTDIKPGCRG